MKATTDLITRPFDVRIPNLEGDGIAETIRIDVPVRIDPDTGEEVLMPEALELIEKTKARRMGLMSPDEIRELRERLALTQEEMSELLQIGAKTYTRWETSRARVSRSMNVILCALRDGAITIEYLRCLREGRDWTPLLNRRIQNSIVFLSESSESPRALSEVWGSVEAALANVGKQQFELKLAERPARSIPPERQFKVGNSTTWVEDQDLAAA
jgi:DNA-binding transcriptional regulator YiaG